MATDPRTSDRHCDCTHCGLPVPPGLIDEGGTQQFCCSGCRAVFEAIRGAGLDRYYELKDGADETPARPTDRVYDDLDDEAFLDLAAPVGPDGIRHVDLYLEGVHCAACVWLVERLPWVVGGVREATLDLGRQVARIAWDPEDESLSRIARTLDRFGYAVHPYRRAELHRVRRQEQRRHFIRIGVAGACAGNVMLIAFALYGGAFSGIDPQYRTLLRLTSLMITLIALAGPGHVFFAGALTSLRTRVMHMDVPVALALAAGTAWGAWNTIRGGGEVYFESITAVVFLLLVGRWLQYRHQRTAHDAVELLYCLTPSTARRVAEDASIQTVPVEGLRCGDRIELRAGDSAPADGVLVAGRARFDVSLLTGESRPVTITAGDRVHAGTVNLHGRTEILVEATGGATRIGRLMMLVERLASERPPIVSLANRIAHSFVITVVSLAALTVVLWWRRDPGLAIEHAIALLIVTCPCALGLATPLAVTAAVGRAARAGILIKGGAALEQLARPATLILDKTGTITAGNTALVRWTGDESARPLARALEEEVSHPIAAALRAALPAPATPPLMGSVEPVAGAGIQGDVDGRRVIVGSPRWVRSQVEGLPAAIDAAVSEALRDALSPVLVAIDGHIVACAAFGDPVHPEAAAAIRALKGLGCTVRVLSGDHPDVAAAVARAVDVDDVEGGADPERKATAVQETRSSARPVVMVGDGVNDAAALAAADVGVAVHGGVEASLTAADVFLRRDGLAPLVTLLTGSRRTMRVIRRNLTISLAYNAVAAALAMTGFITPLVAAILMPLSSLTVLSLSFRSRTFVEDDAGVPNDAATIEGRLACP